jgi:NADH-quinone oxidoreductase subunit L
VVAWTGALTAIFAATIAITQTDIKKVLAYSTVSQLGYMFLAAGCGGYSAAVFHLGTHAFFKALLFLGAGAVILAMHHEQDVRKMGGLHRSLRQTHLVFLAGVLAIAGFPGTSGFFSKDEMLVAAWTSSVPGTRWLHAIGLVTAGLTSFYMFRLYFLTFWGESRAPREVREHLHDAAPVVINPLWVLAFFSIFAGLGGLPQVWGDLIGVPESNSVGNFLAPVLASGHAHEIDHATEYALASAAVGVAATFSGLYRLLLNKYWIDELYDAVIVRPLVWVSDRVLFRGVDAGLIDGVAVNGSAGFVRGIAASGLKYAQSGLTQGYIFFMIAGAVAIVAFLLRSA